MAVNQPKIGKDQADNSWKLEVTQQVNNEEARINSLLSRIEALEAERDTSSGGAVSGTLQITNYVQLVQDNTLEYTFSGAGLLTNLPHQLYIGGQKLIETVDYNPSSSVNGRITLTSQPVLPSNQNMMEQLMIELSIWSL